MTFMWVLATCAYIAITCIVAQTTAQTGMVDRCRWVLLWAYSLSRWMLLWAYSLSASSAARHGRRRLLCQDICRLTCSTTCAHSGGMRDTEERLSCTVVPCDSTCVWGSGDPWRLKNLYARAAVESGDARQHLCILLLKELPLTFQAQEAVQIKAPRLKDKEEVAAKCQGPQFTELPQGYMHDSRLKVSHLSGRMHDPK